MDIDIFSLLSKTMCIDVGTSKTWILLRHYQQYWKHFYACIGPTRKNGLCHFIEDVHLDSSCRSHVIEIPQEFQSILFPFMIQVIGHNVY